MTKIPALRNPIFISDLHLSDERPATKEMFFRFLKKEAARFSELVILGDLFEFWAGDDHAPSYADVMYALREYSLLGHRLYVMHGNRDFLLGQDFSTATGAVLISDPQVVQIGLDRVLLSHGDMWCTKDQDYMDFRATLRNPEVQRQILGEALEHRIELAGGLRSQSESENKAKPYEALDVCVTSLTRTMEQFGVSLLIHGHTHKPAHHTHVCEDIRVDRWVLPDWDFDNGNQRGGYLCFENGYIHFGHFD